MSSVQGSIGRVSWPFGVLRLFVRWYIVDHPCAVLRAYAAYAAAAADVFSIVFLLKTLFSPWKNIVDTYGQRGLNLNRLFQVITFNVTTRAIGAVIRVATIAFSILLQCALLTGCLIYLAAWFAYPFALLGLAAFLLQLF